MNMFEKASRKKLRFDTAMGKVSVEDLWDMPLTSRQKDRSLDDLAKSVSRQLKQEDEESFVAKASARTTDLNLKLEILKHVIASKIEAKEAAEQRQAKEQKRKKILEVIERKEESSLEDLPLEELKKMANEE